MISSLKKSAQTQVLLPALILCVLLNLLFFPVIWGDKTLLHSSNDASSIMPYGAFEHNKQIKQSRRSNDDGAPAWFSEPSYALLNFEYFKNTSPPLWNPYNGFGAPFLANMQSQPFNPLILIACINPSPASADIFVLCRLLVAGILMNVYLRKFIGAYGAIFGAIAYMLTGYFVIFMNMPELSTSMWMPGLLLTLENLAESATFKNIVWSGFLTAMVLLGGMPEVAFLVLVVCGIYFIVRSFYHQRTSNTRWRALLCYALASTCGIALAAPQLFPFIEYIKESSNSHAGTLGAGGAAGPGSVFRGNFLAHFINYLAPLIYGPLGEARVKPGFAYDGFNGYWGVLTFTFALLAGMFGIKHWRSAFAQTEKSDSLDKSSNTQTKSDSLDKSSNAQTESDSLDDSSLSNADSLAKKSSNAVSIVLFFTCVALCFLGKTFGSPLINWIAMLPLFKLVIYFKYGEPLIGLSIAILAGIGFELLFKGKVSKRQTAIVFATSLIALIGVGLFDKRFIWGDREVHSLFNKILTLSAVLIVVAFSVSWLALAKPATRAKSCRLLLLLLCADLSLNFLLPTFFWLHQLGTKTANPYAGAPYIDFLKSNIANQDRVIGFDGVLFPNWSSAFQIQDVRNLDAMYPARYLSFIRNFLTDVEAKELSDNDITNRFNGLEKLADPLFATASDDSLKRLWYLTSVRYFLGTRDHFIGRPSELTVQMLRQIPKTNAERIHLDAFNINGQIKHVLFHHPSGNSEADEISTECIVSKDKPILNFSIGMHPEVYGIAYGDGMTFKVIIKQKNASIKSSTETGDGQESGRHSPSTSAARSSAPQSPTVSDAKSITVFEKYIDPKTRSVDRHWFNQQVDLTKYAGQKIDLILAVDGGPSNNFMADWGGWADLEFDAGNSSTPSSDQSAQTATKPALIYDKEIKVFKTNSALPRAALFYDYKLAKDDAAALRLLKAKEFDVSKSIVLDGSAVDRFERVILPPPSSDPVICDEQKITSYAPLAVKVEVQAKRDGFLMLNDQYYPGWKAYVDGLDTEILRSDFVFRAVAVKEGPHEVIFRYEPFSFYLGTCTSALTLFILSAYGFFVGRKSTKLTSSSTESGNT